MLHKCRHGLYSRFAVAVQCCCIHTPDNGAEDEQDQRHHIPHANRYQPFRQQLHTGVAGAVKPGTRLLCACSVLLWFGAWSWCNRNAKQQPVGALAGCHAAAAASLVGHVSSSRMPERFPAGWCTVLPGTMPAYIGMHVIANCQDRPPAIAVATQLLQQHGVGYALMRHVALCATCAGLQCYCIAALCISVSPDWLQDTSNTALLSNEKAASLPHLNRLLLHCSSVALVICRYQLHPGAASGLPCLPQEPPQQRRCLR